MKKTYLDRYAWPGPIIIQEPKAGIGIIVVIPAFSETEILNSLKSLESCDLPDCGIEVIIVVNFSNSAGLKIKMQSTACADDLEEWITLNRKSPITYHVIRAFDLNPKIAGVGLARKIGMDEAVRRFEQLNKKRGVIACFDADCLCSKNYLLEIFKTYLQHPETNVGLVYFEHPIEGALSKQIYDGIINYELHLRYYRNALAYAKYPYSYHTIGSCITVTSEAYQKQGGMNKRKAGEDFYFLQRLFPLGNVKNINAATVIPSSRPSKRVPFGTGRAISEYQRQSTSKYYTYNQKIFTDLKIMLNDVNKLYEKMSWETLIKNWPISVQLFISKFGFADKILKIKKNSTTLNQFKRSFYQWFNGFMVMKYVHFSRDNFYENIEVLDASNWILSELNHSVKNLRDKKEALELLRKTDRSDQRKQI